MASVINYIIDNKIEELDKDKLINMLKIANAAAALITTKKGAIKSMPKIEEIKELIN